MVDDPTTPFDEHQVLMAFGDTFGDRSVPGEDWRFNVLMRSADHVLGDGMDVPDGEFGNGNWYGGMPLWDVPPGRTYENYARRIINPESLPAGAQPGITLIPTAGISVPTPSNQVRGHAVRQLHVGDELGFARSVDDELLRRSRTRRTTARTGRSHRRPSDTTNR